MNTNQVEKAENFETEFPKITLWEKGNKSRMYVKDCGYITEDSDDVKGHNNDYYKGFYYQYDRPGKANTLRRVIEAITEGE